MKLGTCFIRRADDVPAKTRLIKIHIDIRFEKFTHITLFILIFDSN